MTVRETEEYQNENGSVVRVHKVTDETAGGVHLTGVGSSEVREGDYLVQDSTNSWTKLDSLDGLKSVDSKGSSARKSSVDSGEFDPSKHTVDEVNDYLVSATESEYVRVVDAEKANKNRAGIVNGR